MKKSELFDLKQFIATTISDSELRLEKRLSDSFNPRFDALEKTMAEGFADVGDAI